MKIDGADPFAGGEKNPVVELAAAELQFPRGGEFDFARERKRREDALLMDDEVVQRQLRVAHAADAFFALRMHGNVGHRLEENLEVFEQPVLDREGKGVILSAAPKLKLEGGGELPFALLDDPRGLGLEGEVGVGECSSGGDRQCGQEKGGAGG